MQKVIIMYGCVQALQTAPNALQQIEQWATCIVFQQLLSQQMMMMQSQQQHIFWRLGDLCAFQQQHCLDGFHSIAVISLSLGVLQGWQSKLARWHLHCHSLHLSTHHVCLHVQLCVREVG
jgi:hypothetical protein